MMIKLMKGCELIENGNYVKDILAKQPGARLTAQGWVKTRRDSKGVHFLQVQDGSSAKDLQVVIEAGAVPDVVLSALTTGSSVAITGVLVPSMGAGQAVELRASEVQIYGQADPATYPLQKKGHTMEFLREIAHLRPRSNTFSSVFRVRSVLSLLIHQFFQERGFIYFHSPIITTSDAEGAGTMFGVTTLDLLNVPRNGSGQVDYSQDFFGKAAFLTVSGQLEAEMAALAFSNVYTFSPCFRAEKSTTPRHLAEFWMIEPEMAFCDLEDCRRLAVEFLKFLITGVLNTSRLDLEFFDKRIDNGLLAMLEHVATSDFAHVTYTEAVSVLEDAARKGREWQFPVYWGCDLQSEHERFLTEEVFKKPMVVTDYPKEIKAFYMRMNEDERTVRAMDVLVPRIGEIIGGSQREERYDVLRSRIRQFGLNEENYNWYLDLRKYGSVPHAGFGLGLERILMYVTGMKNIRDVIPSPRTFGSALF